MKTDTVIMLAFIGAIVFLGVTLLINTSKSCDVNIDYKASFGSENNATTSSLAEVKLACYKLCLENLGQNNYGIMDKCLNKCEGLG